MSNPHLIYDIIYIYIYIYIIYIYIYTLQINTMPVYLKKSDFMVHIRCFWEIPTPKWIRNSARVLWNGFRELEIP